jgi:hypothetical protein
MSGNAQEDRMNDRELVSLAVLRLHESARRLEALVEHTRSPGLKLWLASLARRLGEHADRATIINAVAEDDAVGDMTPRPEQRTANGVKAGTG